METNLKPDRGRVEVNQEECKGCGLCVDSCAIKVLRLSEGLNHYGYHPAEYCGPRLQRLRPLLLCLPGTRRDHRLQTRCPGGRLRRS